MKDFRQYKETVKKAIDKVNESANWKWTAKILKGQIKLYNDYIKGQYEKDFFSIEYEESPLDNECIIGHDCLDMPYVVAIAGEERYADGSIEECIEQAIRSAERFFSSRY